MGPLELSDPLPYWLVNVPHEKWPAECPPYLRGLSAKDTTHLAVRDADYHWLTWDEVQNIVASNRLHAFFRLPSELRRYRWYCWTIERDYGSVMAYIIQERLQWTSLEPSDHEPLVHGSDYKVLHNDWPYGLDQRIVHLVVWSKHQFEADTTTGELTTDAYNFIDRWVQCTFGTAVLPHQLIWFKNPISLRSVGAIEHFHVMLFDPDPAVVAQATNNDVPMSAQINEIAKREYM